MIDSMLSTVDNPFNPFTQYDEWYAFDSRAGYHCPGLLARITVMSDDMSEADQSWAIEVAIDEIVSENVSGMFVKILDPSPQTEAS